VVPARIAGFGRPANAGCLAGFAAADPEDDFLLIGQVYPGHGLDRARRLSAGAKDFQLRAAIVVRCEVEGRGRVRPPDRSGLTVIAYRRDVLKACRFSALPFSKSL